MLIVQHFATLSQINPTIFVITRYPSASNILNKVPYFIIREKGNSITSFISTSQTTVILQKYHHIDRLHKVLCNALIFVILYESNDHFVEYYELYLSHQYL